MFLNSCLLISLASDTFPPDISTCLVDPHPDGHANAPKAKIQVWIHKTPEFEELSAPVHLHMRHGRTYGRIHGGHHRGHSSHHHHHHYHHGPKGAHSNTGRAAHRGTQRQRLEAGHDIDTGNTQRINHMGEEVDIIEVSGDENMQLANFASTDHADSGDDSGEENSDAGIDGVNIDPADLVNEEIDADADADEVDVREAGETVAGNTKGDSKNGKKDVGSGNVSASEKPHQDGDASGGGFNPSN